MKALLVAIVTALFALPAYATGGAPAPKPVQKVTTINKSNNVSVNPSFHDETNVQANPQAYGGYVGTVGNDLNVEAVRNAPDVLAYPTAPCRVAIGGSAAFAGFGGGLSGSVADENCQRIETSRQLYNLGQRDAALQIMCLSLEAHKALTAAGVVCKLRPEAPADSVKP